MRQVLNRNILISLNVLDCCCCFVSCMCSFDLTGMFPLTSLSVLGCTVVVVVVVVVFYLVYVPLT